MEQGQKPDCGWRAAWRRGRETDRMYKGTRRKGEEGGGQQAEWDLGWMDWVLFPFCPVDVSVLL